MRLILRRCASKPCYAGNGVNLNRKRQCAGVFLGDWHLELTWWARASNTRNAQEGAENVKE